MSAVTDAPQPRDGEQRARIVATAARLFREIGYQKTTVADIARELRMSPANVYRFFGAKSEINAAVARQLMSEVEGAAAHIVQSAAPATERLRALIAAIERMNAERYVADRKLHDMVEAALVEDWPIISEHIDRIDALIEAIVTDGMAGGEFAKRDPHLAARLVHVACVRFFHPRLIAECADYPLPTSAQMVEFCLAALRAGYVEAAGDEALAPKI